MYGIFFSYLYTLKPKLERQMFHSFLNPKFAPIIFWLVVSNTFYFHPYFGEMIQFDEHIFQMGWNHHLWKLT